MCSIRRSGPRRGTMSQRVSHSRSDQCLFNESRIEPWKSVKVHVGIFGRKSWCLTFRSPTVCCRQCTIGSIRVLQYRLEPS